MQDLKQSTAFTERIGPVLDATGAEYASLVIGDLSITKNGTTAAMAAAATLTYDTNGYYTLVGTTGNTDTLGRLTITVNKATYQMAPRTFMVLPATVWDLLYANAAGGANGFLLSDANNRVDLAKWLGTAPLALSSQQVQAVVPDNQKVDLNTVNTQAVTAAAPVTFPASIASQLSVDDMPTNAEFAAALPANFSSLGITIVGAISEVQLVDGLGAGAISSSTFGIGAITAGAIATDALGALELSAGAATEIATAVRDISNASPAANSLGADAKAAKDNASSADAKLTLLQAIFANITSLAQWLGLIAGKQVGNGTARTELRATGAGSGTFDETTDSTQAIRDRGDVAWTSGSSSITVQPLQNTINERVSATTIQAYYNETGWTIGPVLVTDASESPVDLTVYDDLKLIIQDAHGTDLLVTTSVTISGDDDNQWTATGTSAVTVTAPARNKWALRGISTGVNVVLGRGDVIVSEAADVDPEEGE